jgi:D-sedoheptulose 7-phosphate isomerase
MDNTKFLTNYNQKISLLIESVINQKDIYNKTIKKIKNIKINKNKVIIFGNGGSASTASHFSTDLTKNARIKCINFNESNLITCFSNDYGFENFVAQALNEYANKGDLLILLSVSGESKNLINASRFCKKKKIALITFTGKKDNNSLIKSNKTGINLHINSNSYNIVEICHHLILLSIVDNIIGKENYGTSLGKI